MKKILALCCFLLLLGAVPLQAKERHGEGAREERRSEESRSEGEYERSERNRGEYDRGEHRSEERRDKSWHHDGKHHKSPPAGWRRKINKGKRVDDTIYGYMEPPTPEVIAVLPPPPPGVSFRQIENKIVKLNDINRQIIEVLELDKLPIPKPPKIPLPPLPPLPR